MIQPRQYQRFTVLELFHLSSNQSASPPRAASRVFLSVNSLLSPSASSSRSDSSEPVTIDLINFQIISTRPATVSYTHSRAPTISPAGNATTAPPSPTQPPMA